MLSYEYKKDFMVGLPTAPSGIRIEACSTCVKVAWDPHPEENIAFELTFQMKGSSSVSKVSGVKLNHYVIGGLTPDSEYTIVVRAKNDYGFGTASSTLIIMTKAKGTFSYTITEKHILFHFFL